MNHPAESSLQIENQQADIVRRITTIGMVLNLLLIFAKGIGGFVFHSQTLIADGVHSFSDLITDIILLCGVKYWTAPPDQEHPYGHGRIETLISAVIGVALALVAFELCKEALEAFHAPEQSEITWFAALIAFFSVVSKELLYRKTTNIAKKIHSTALQANAWHHRSDAISSIPALLSLSLAAFLPNMRFMDAIGALIVSLFIFHAAFKIIVPPIKELVDTSVSEDLKSNIASKALSVDGIRGIHAIRARRSGSGVLVDLHIKVDPDMTVAQGHRLSHRVKSALLTADMNICDAIIHVEPFEEDTPTLQDHGNSEEKVHKT